MWKKFNGKKVTESFRSECSKALLRAGQDTKQEILTEIPHDEGTLQDTVTVMLDPQNDLKLAIGAGGGGLSQFPIVPYAIKHHEVPANFQKGRKRNYVRDPVKNTLPREIKRELTNIGLK